MMKPTLQPRRFSRLLLLPSASKHHGPKPRSTAALFRFLSTRPMKEEQLHQHHHHHANLMNVNAAQSFQQEHSAINNANDDDVDVATKEFQSPSELHYTGNATMPLTSVLRIVKPGEDAPRGTWPVFRLMDEDGKFRDPAFDAARQGTTTESLVGGTTSSANKAAEATTGANELTELRSELQREYPFHSKEFEETGLLRPSKHSYPDTDSKNTLMRAHLQMVRLREMDTILQNAQRQGRISFYMTCHGEEAIHFGSASALDNGDTVFAQYREAGLLMWRGFTLEQFTNQCFSNDMDLGKGRQMPVHYGSRALNYQTISSPLGTQIPQAMGAAYHFKLQQKPNVAICFFGDGAASTTDFHSGLNFAATLKAPVIFFCRNNGFAISTSVSDQYAGDGIISRAPGYGMAAIRVDGNDLFAVHAAVREAREYCLKNSAPILIEAMTYRLGHHSTSDDSSRYRCKTEVEAFQDRSDPLQRVDNFLKRHQWITESDLQDARNEEKRAVLTAMSAAEERPPPSLRELFTDVYKELTPQLKKQKAQLEEHLKKHKGKY